MIIDANKKIRTKILMIKAIEFKKEAVLASGDNRHSGSGEKGQFWSNEKRHLQIE